MLSKNLHTLTGRSHLPGDVKCLGNQKRVRNSRGHLGRRSGFQSGSLLADLEVPSSFSDFELSYQMSSVHFKYTTGNKYKL